MFLLESYAYNLRRSTLRSKRPVSAPQNSPPPLWTASGAPSCRQPWSLQLRHSPGPPGELPLSRTWLVIQALNKQTNKQKHLNIDKKKVYIGLKDNVSQLKQTGRHKYKSLSFPKRKNAKMSFRKIFDCFIYFLALSSFVSINYLL